MATPLHELLEIPRGVTAIIGGGGKTALMYRLAHELPGKVILCTMYEVYPPQGMAMFTLSGVIEGQASVMLSTLMNENRVCFVGASVGNGKFGPSTISHKRLTVLADYVLVECDESGGFPVKVHEDGEPRLPEEPDRILSVFGAQAFDRPIPEVTNNPALFYLLTGASRETPMRPDLVAKAFRNERICKYAYINQVESREALAQAERFVEASDAEGIVAGSLKLNVYTKYR